MERVNPEATRILNAAGAGDRKAAEQLIPLVYEELTRYAAWRLAQEYAPTTVQAAALVHEAYLRLSPGKEQWDGRTHFFAAAAEAMRRILVERARRRKAVQHGGDARLVELAEDRIAAPFDNHEELLAVHEIVDRLAEIESRKAEVVKLRYFIGMTIKESAEALGISEMTVKRDWAFAKAWLYREWNRE